MRLACLVVLMMPLASAAIGAPAMPMTAASGHPLAGRIFAIATAAVVTPAALVTALSRADVAILGEVHDNPEHHAVQAWLTRALAPAGLAFEMFPASVEGGLARLRAARASREAIAAVLDWQQGGWPDFAMYAPIMEAAPDAAITGGAVPRAALTLAMRDGAAAAGRAAIGIAVSRYRLGDAPDAAALAASTAEQMAAHCGAIPEAVAARMAEAQRLRDAAFADAVLRARALGNDGRVVLITGNGHARTDRGVPLFLRVAEPGLTVTSLAVVEVADGQDDWRGAAFADGIGIFDYVWFTAPQPREDPCDAFVRQRG